MSVTRFSALPEHAIRVVEEHEIEGIVLGTERNWVAPVALWRAPRGFDARSKPENHPHHTFTFSHSGHEVTLASADGRRTERSTPRRENICLQPPSVDLLFECRGSIRFAHLYFQDAYLREVAEELFGTSARYIETLFDPNSCFRDDGQLSMALESYLVRARAPAPPTSVEMDSRSALIALHALTHHSVLKTSAEFRPMALAPARLNRVKAYIDEHLAEDLSLAAIAAEADLSAFHFARAFKRETGIAPHRFLMERRVERARDLLGGTRLQLAEIALACGFAGQSHFTTAFKRHTGVTPGAWRAAVRH